MKNITILLADEIVSLLLVGTATATILVPAAWCFAKTCRLEAPVYRQMLWMYCLVGITLTPVLWLYMPKLTLEILPAKQNRGIIVQTSAVAENSHDIMANEAPVAYAPMAAQPRVNFLSIESSGVDSKLFKVAIAAIWLSVALLIFLRLVFGRLSLEKLCAVATPIQRDNRFHPIGCEGIRLLVSEHIQGPVCFGLLRPTIILPQLIYNNSSGKELQMILNHELAHIRRRDYWANLFQRIVESCFFFHPFVWWVSVQLTQERERICDNHVLESGASARDYADLLARIAEHGLRRRGLASIALIEGGLLHRVQRVLDPHRSRKTKLSILMSVAVAVTAVSSLAALGGVRLVADQKDDAASKHSGQSIESTLPGDVDDEAFEMLRMLGEKAKDNLDRLQAGRVWAHFKIVLYGEDGEPDEKELTRNVLALFKGEMVRLDIKEDGESRRLLLLNDGYRYHTFNDPQAYINTRESGLSRERLLAERFPQTLALSYIYLLDEQARIGREMSINIEKSSLAGTEVYKCEFVYADQPHNLYRLWIDSERGGIALKSEIHRVSGDGHILLVVQERKLQPQRSVGGWYIARSKERAYRSDGTLRHTKEMNIMRCDFAIDVPDATFTWEGIGLPVGTVIIDKRPNQTRRKTYTAPLSTSGTNEPWEKTEEKLEKTDATSIYGSVVLPDASKSFPRTVQLYGTGRSGKASAVVDESGRFKFNNVVPGAYEITLLETPDLPGMRIEGVVVEYARPPSEQIFVAGGSTVELVVEDQLGHGISGARVIIGKSGEGNQPNVYSWRQGVTDSLGRFIAKNLVDGRYVVSSKLTNTSAASTVNVLENDYVQARLRHWQSDLHLRGSVTDSYGKSISGLPVVLESKHKILDGNTSWRTETLPSGEFVFNNVPPGKFNVIAKGPNGKVTKRRVRATETSIVPGYILIKMRTAHDPGPISASPLPDPPPPQISTDSSFMVGEPIRINVSTIASSKSGWKLDENRLPARDGRWAW